MSTTPPRCAHAEVLPAPEEWTDADHAVLADLGYEGEADALVLPGKKIDGRPLSDDQRGRNALHVATRALAERGGALLKTTFKRPRPG